MSVEIITIGDELLIGQVVDTNSAWMSEQLNMLNMPVGRIVTVHDDAVAIRSALQEALCRSDIVLLTGGLGPTKDDITKGVLCDMFGTTLVHSDAVEANIRRLWANRNRSVINELTLLQAMVPANCEVIQNDVGTAPIMWWNRDGRVVVSMPGVPYEMKYAMTQHVLPRLQALQPSDSLLMHRVVIVEGVAESVIAQRLNDWETSLPDYMHLAYLPAQGLVRLRLDACVAMPEEQLTAAVDGRMAALCEIMGDDIVAFSDEPLEVTLGTMLRGRGFTIASAESCTGGTVASLLSHHAGSSDFYLGSVVSYADSVKHEVLGVDAGDLATVGAVSETVVRQMAEGVRRVTGADWGLATSGYAGPTGGVDVPVGTIWIAVSGPAGTWSRCLHLGSLRQQNIERTTQAVLAMAIRLVRSKDID